MNLLYAFLLALLAHLFILWPWHARRYTGAGRRGGGGAPIELSGAEPSEEKKAPARERGEGESAPSGRGNGGAGSEGLPGGVGVADERARYLADLKAAIARERIYPPAARESGEQGTVGVAFAVSADGILSEVHVDKPSASERLNRAALNAVQRLGKFTAPPGGPVSARIDLEYRLD